MTYNYITFNKASSEEAQTVLSAIQKNHKETTIHLGLKGGVNQAAVISSGSLKLDKALGIGGYAVGRHIELIGMESSGKTTLTLHAIANCQKAGGRAAFIDAEHALDINYAKSLGVDIDELILVQPDCAEEALEIVDNLASSGIVNLIVVDSVAALVPRKELEGEMGDAVIGLQARLMSQAMRKLTGICAQKNITVLWINQIRHKIGVMFGNPETTSGGNALKFYASQRLDIRKTGQSKDGDEATGSLTKVKIIKNKLAPPYRVAEFEISFGVGINSMQELIDLAVEAKIINRSGSWYSYKGEKLGQGNDNLISLLKTNDKLFNEVKTAVMNGFSSIEDNINTEDSDDTQDESTAVSSTTSWP